MSVALVWFRQDLRISDNPALTHACANYEHVIPLYIDDETTAPLGGAQKWWLHHSLLSLEKNLAKIGLHLCLQRGDAADILENLVKQHHIEAVFWNRCYEPGVIKRDQALKTNLRSQHITLNSFNASLLNEPWTVQNKSGSYFKVFTPYWRQCLTQVSIPSSLPAPKPQSDFMIAGETLTSWNLLPTQPNWANDFVHHWTPGEEGAEEKLQSFTDFHLRDYKTLRDHPAKQWTSRLSPHLHFGEISPWQVWRAIQEAEQNPRCDLASAERFLAELGWREFSYYLLYHFPSLSDKNFKSEFDRFPWLTDANALQHWQQGKTGYPIVDAGMRELWQTGYMHNRVRMIVASFLTKHLLIDWRVGAAWFLDTLLDADLASNSASWQWVAGCGADAAPYFRIFNPTLQGEKFDPDGDYIKRWVPELANVDKQWIHQPWLHANKTYPAPIVDHSFARGRALEIYGSLKRMI